MSYILDALKKADEARRRTKSPALDRVRAPRAAPRRRWPWIVVGAALVAANAGVLVYTLRPSLGPAPGALASAARGRTETPGAVIEPPRDSGTVPLRSAPTSSEPTRKAAPPAVRAESSPVSMTRSEAAKPAPPTPVAPRAEERPALAPAPPTPVPSVAPRTPPPTQSAAGATTTTKAPPLPMAAVAPVVPAPEPRAAQTPAASRPPAPEAPLAGDEVLSKLKLTVHVYAENPADRLVFINGSKYVQGDRIDGKAVLEEITQEGAVVSFEGRRAVLRY